MNDLKNKVSKDVLNKIKTRMGLFREKDRLATFKSWIFKDNTPCSALKLAEAGFYFIGTRNEPDAVKCFFCEKSLDSWDEDDDPWSEHLKHAPNCKFAKLQTPESCLTINEYIDLIKSLEIELVKKFFEMEKQKLNTQFESVKKELASLS